MQELNGSQEYNPVTLDEEHNTAQPIKRRRRRKHRTEVCAGRLHIYIEDRIWSSLSVIHDFVHEIERLKCWLYTGAHDGSRDQSLRGMTDFQILSDLRQHGAPHAT